MTPFFVPVRVTLNGPPTLMSEFNPTHYEQRLIDRVEAVAIEQSPFTAGDTVTLAPTDTDRAYYGSHLEGCRLTIERFHRPRANRLCEAAVDPWLHRDPERSRDQLVDVPDADAQIAVAGARWRFEEGPWALKDHLLVSWDEYYERGMKIPVIPDDPRGNDDEYHYVRDTSAADDCATQRCPGCQSSWIERRGRQEPMCGHIEKCAVCDKTLKAVI